MNHPPRYTFTTRVAEAGVAAEFSGVEIQVGAGKEVVLWWLGVHAGDCEIALFPSTYIDQGTAEVTPAGWGPGGYTRTSIVQRGRALAALPGLRVAAVANTPSVFSQAQPLLVARAGLALVMLASTANTAFAASFLFEERDE
jgi:hypothetical protein